MAMLLICPFITLANELDNPTVEDDSLWAKMKNNLTTTWHSSNYDLYLPVNTWHNRWFYNKEKIDKYNERPWGIGFGVSRYDSDGDWHSIYAMEFQDSHNMFEPIFGYGYQKVWRPSDSGNWRLALGFTAAVTMRQEYNYIPLPLVLPMFSIEYKKIALQSAYIPGTRNNGNVLFTWIRWQI